MLQTTNRQTNRLLLIALAALSCGAWPTRSTAQTHADVARRASAEALVEISVSRDVPVQMPDGVTLMADVYRPAEPGTYPVVLLRTPYNKAQHASMGPYFAKRGYALVAQDVRGKYKSQGSFNAWAQERDDGIATLDWLVKQPWCNQKIGAWGPSYLGFTSLVLAPSGHPALKAVVNISGPGDVYRTLFPGGSLHLSAMMPWSLMMANGRRQVSPGELQRSIHDLMKFVPLSHADKAAGAIVPFWQSLIDHPRNAAFWTDMGISKQYGDIKVPILHITGWNDFICRHTLEVFNGIREASPETVQKIHVGPWHHDQAGTNTTRSGDEEFGAQAALGEDGFYQLAMRWFDHYLKGIDNGAQRDAIASYFVMGRNEWTNSDAWPPKDVRYVDWYLAGGSKGAGSGGRLTRTAPSRDDRLSFVYDPHDPVPTTGGANFHFFRSNLGVKDQRAVERRDDVLVFSSPPLEEAIQIVGPIAVTLFAATDATDTDFTAKLVEVRSDGYARIIEDGIVRGRFRDSQFQAKLMRPGEVYELSIDLGATAIEIKKGHQIRIEISSSNFPKCSRNPNTGEDPMTASVFKSARQTIFTGGSYPSRVTLPIRVVR